MYRVEVGLSPVDGREAVFDLNLAQTIWRTSGQDSDPPPLIRRTGRLIEQVQAIGFAFYGDLDDNNGPQWRDNWNHPIKLPSMVALDVAFAPGDPRRWDRIIMPVYSSEAAATNCPPRGRCR
jgi:hypothetical protein